MFFRTSSRGTRQLVINGYSFICRSYCLNHIKKIWKCASNADCTAKVHTVEDEIISLNNDHNHPSNPFSFECKPPRRFHLGYWRILNRPKLEVQNWTCCCRQIMSTSDIFKKEQKLNTKRNEARGYIYVHKCLYFFKFYLAKILKLYHIYNLHHMNSISSSVLKNSVISARAQLELKSYRG